MSFKNPLCNRITDLVPDNFVISTANKKLVLQEKQAKLLSDTVSEEQKDTCMLYFRPRATKDSWFVCHFSGCFLKIIIKQCVPVLT